MTWVVRPEVRADCCGDWEACAGGNRLPDLSLGSSRRRLTDGIAAEPIQESERLPDAMVLMRRKAVLGGRRHFRGVASGFQAILAGLEDRGIVRYDQPAPTASTYAICRPHLRWPQVFVASPCLSIEPFTGKSGPNRRRGTHPGVLPEPDDDTDGFDMSRTSRQKLWLPAILVALLVAIAWWGPAPDRFQIGSAVLRVRSGDGGRARSVPLGRQLGIPVRAFRIHFGRP